jgi:hypothetical protein
MNAMNRAALAALSLSFRVEVLCASVKRIPLQMRVLSGQCLRHSPGSNGEHFFHWHSSPFGREIVSATGPNRFQAVLTRVEHGLLRKQAFLRSGRFPSR